MSDFLWPNGTTSKPYVSSPFGPRNINVPNASKNHKGADFSKTFTIIRAVASGQVKVAGTPSGWSGGGTQVWVQHDGFFSKSLHASSLLVKVGQFVRAGDALCVMGQTGTASDDHLHLEITPGQIHYSNSGQVDPVAFLAARIGGTPAGSGSGSAAAPATPEPIWEDDIMRIFKDTSGTFWFVRPGALVAIRGVADLQLLRRMLNSRSTTDGKDTEALFNPREADIIRSYVS